jgi:DNA replication licensing factor MCM7
MAALPSITVDVNYEEDKSPYALWSFYAMTNARSPRHTEDMKTFLSKYTSKADLSADMADMGLEDQMEDDDRPNMQAKYMRQLVRWLLCAVLLTANWISATTQQAIANREQQMLIIDLEDIYEFQQSVSDLCSRVIRNARRYAMLFSEVVDELMPEPTKDISNNDDVLEVILHQRREKTQENAADELAGFPPQLLRR